MTAAERRQVERLKTRIDEQQRALDHAHRVSGNLIHENVNLRCALQDLRQLLAEAQGIMNEVEVEK
jgi:regulator of replication initiation timing